MVGEGRKQEGKGDDDIFCVFEVVLCLVFGFFNVDVLCLENVKENPRKKGF